MKFLRSRVLTEITRDEVAAIGATKRAESSSAVANRYLALIRAIFAKGVPGVAMDRAGAESEDVSGAKASRWIMPSQTRVLLEALPEHQREMTLFALATGLMQCNVADLCWAQVHLKRRTVWIVTDEAKSGEDLDIPLCDLALEVLERQRGKDPERVFTCQGKPVRYGNPKAWRNASSAQELPTSVGSTCVTPGRAV